MAGAIGFRAWINTAPDCPTNALRRPMDHLSYFRNVYDAFNCRDADRVLAAMTEDVDWPNAWKGGRLAGRDAVRAYWTEQWAEIDARVEPVSVLERPDGGLAVTVRQVVRSPSGETLSDGEVVHVYRLRDGLIRRMDVEEVGASTTPERA
jgi:hypothetical protein